LKPGQTGKVSTERIARTGLHGKNSQERSRETEKHSQARVARTGQPGQDSQNRPAEPGQLVNLLAFMYNKMQKIFIPRESFFLSEPNKKR
jgi:hypothetical protein